MGGLKEIKINNSKDKAVKTGTWSNPGAKLYDDLLDAFYCVGDIPTDAETLDQRIKEGKYLQWFNYLKEAYLVAPISKIKNSPYGRTPFSRSGCHYPHHIIRNGELILSIPGLKAAYNRAIQMDILKGEVKEHLERHIKELGIEDEFKDKRLSWNKNTEYEEFDESSKGKLNFSYRQCVNIENGHIIEVIFDLNPKTVMQLGDHTNQAMRDFKKDTEKIKNIRKTGYTDFSSYGTVKAIKDIDTNKQLNTVTTIGIVGNGGTRFTVPEEYVNSKYGENSTDFTRYPVDIRENIAKELNLNPKDAITFTVGEKEKIPSYKSTRSSKSYTTVYNNQWRSGRGVHKKSDYISVAKSELNKANMSNMHITTAVDKLVKEFNKIKPLIEDDPDGKEDIDDFNHYLKKIQKEIEDNKGSRYGQNIEDSRYADSYKGLKDALYYMKRTLKKINKKKEKTVKESMDRIDANFDKICKFLTEETGISYMPEDYVPESVFDFNTCSECGAIINDVEIKDVPKSRYDEARKEFPSWDGRYGTLGMRVCPECKKRNYIIENSNMVSSLEDINRFFDDLKDYEYIIPNNGDIITKVDLDAFKKYKSLTPEEFEKYHGGICWDYVAYQADYFNKNFPDIIYKIYFIAFINGDDNPSHSVMLFNYSGKWYYKERSWKSNIVNKIYDTEKDAINDITLILLRHNDYLQNGSFKTVITKYDPSSCYGLNEHDLYQKIIPNFDKLCDEEKSHITESTENPLDEVVFYRITHDNEGIYEALRKQVSAKRWKELLKSDEFTWLPKPDKYPKGAKSYFTKEGIKMYNELVAPIVDSVIGNNVKMETFTGSEIGEIIYQDKYQVISTGDLETQINESMQWIERFVNDDNFMNIALLESSDVKINRRELLDKFLSINTPEEVLEAMNSIQYGFISKETGERVDQSHKEFDNEDYFYDNYYLQAPGQLLETKLGVCWDQTELERLWFINKGINHAVIYTEILPEGANDGPCHTFLIYETETGCNWFEHSWGPFRGIHEFTTIKDAIYSVITNNQKFNNDTESPVIVRVLKNTPSFGINCNQFYDYARSQALLDMNDISNEIFNEYIDIPDNELESYFDEGIDEVLINIKPSGYFTEAKNDHDIKAFKKRWNYNEAKSTIKYEDREFKVDLNTDIETYKFKYHHIPLDTKKEFIAVYKTTKGPIIVVNKRFWAYESDEQDAFVLHEIGHIVCQLTPKPFPRSVKELIQRIKRAIQRLVTKIKMRKYTKGVHGNAYNELEADMYAAKKSSPEVLKNSLKSYYDKELKYELEKKFRKELKESDIKKKYEKFKASNPNSTMSYEAYKKYLVKKLIEDNHKIITSNKNYTADMNQRIKALDDEKLQKRSKYIKNAVEDDDILNQIVYKERTDVFSESDYFKILKSDLDKDFKPKEHRSLSEFTQKYITNELAKKYKDQGKLISMMRDQNPEYDDDCFLWVDENDDYVCAITYDSKPNKKDGHVWITGLDVAYKYLGCGLGKQLLDYAVDHGVDALSVQVDNEIALRMYKNYGFKVSEQSLKDVEEGKTKQLDLFLNDSNDVNVDEIISESILTEDILNELATDMTSEPAEGYDPPLPLDQLPEHLKDDPVHIWRAEHGIELIHKEPTLEELNRIWENWQLMSDEQKIISDNESIRFFGMKNEDHYKQLLQEYNEEDDILNTKIFTQGDLDEYKISDEQLQEVRNRTFEENYTLNSLPDKLYFGSPNKLTGKTISAKNPRGLFLTPYPGIASIFIVDRFKEAREYFNEILAKNNREIYQSNYNIEYLEWNYDDSKLENLLAKVHMYHNIPQFKEVKTGTSEGFIYEIDVSDIKNELQVFVTKDENREVVYKGTSKLPITRVIQHKIDWEITYKQQKTEGTFSSKVIKESVIIEAAEETDKNGKRRKKLYEAFAEWAKEFHNKNVFGNIFDEDAFEVTYSFIPHEMRYFYRLTNPLLCVLSGDLTFFQASELGKINSENPQQDEYLIFAATPNDMRVFNLKDKKVYLAIEEDNHIVTTKPLGDSFDLYLQEMINKGDILNAPIDEDE